MKITKYGQCCLLIEVEGKRILTDPGKFSITQDTVTDIDIILITHEHADHLHAESMAAILKNNPNAIVITNTGVGTVLKELDIDYQILEGSNTSEEHGILLEAFDGKHVEIFEDMGQVQNTGYFIANELFYPGDAYTEPKKEVPVLALPVSGPWCCLAEAVRYAIAVKPKTTFPVHDAVLNEEGTELTHNLFEAALSKSDIPFVKIKNGECVEF